MKTRRFIILTAATAILGGIALSSCSQTDPQLGKASVDKVIKAMTLHEKASLCVGTGMVGVSGDNPVVGETKNIVPGAAGTTCPIPRLGIPAIVVADGPAGLRIDATRENDPKTYYCTHFPIGTLLACTWNQDLVESVGQALGNEVLEYGADVLLAPALNIHRNPLNGRNFEYYSEDPLVAGKTAAAYVRGVQSNGVGTSVKHFAVNNQESNRMLNDVRISPRALREIYLKGFEITVKESAPWTFMSAFPYINGTYCSENEELLTKVLRDEWGFDGIVMTDWFGGKDPVAQMVAGNELLMPGTDRQIETIERAVEDGVLDEAVLDRNVRRILELVLKTPRFKGYQYSNNPDLEAHAAITRQSATEGMVLLKNDGGALPLGADRKNLALYGCTSYDFLAGGTGSGNVNRAYTVSLTDGLANAGYVVDESMKPAYEKHIASEKARIASEKGTDMVSSFLVDPRPVELALNPAKVREQASSCDAAIITLGRNSGEFMDRKLEDFYLTKEETAMLRTVCTAFHAEGKKVVVVLNVGGVIETASWKDLPDAILLAWQGGQEGGNSVADILSGKANPSGKLTMTFPNKWEDHASSANFPTEGIPNSLVLDDHGEGGTTKRNWDFTEYAEDIYVGYRYFDSFGVDVSYPFGYGLSYTTFEYGDAAISLQDGVYTVNVNVKNTGDVAGKEVVELYVSAPASSLEKPEKELKAYAKTALLQAGESQTVTLEVNAADLASFDEESSAWVTDEGDYRFLIGASSRDIRCELSAHADAASVQVSRVFAPQAPLNRLTK